MAGLADDWQENRQTCVDVLCAYLRMPYEPDPGQDAPELQRLAFQAIREVRHTVIRVITAHLYEDAAVSWQGLYFDFTGVVFDGGEFSGARFPAVGLTSPCPVLRRHRRLPAPSSPALWSTSRRAVLRRHGQLQPRPVLRRHGLASATPGSPAARSASTAPSSPARSTSAAAGSPAARSASTMPVSLAQGRLRRHRVLRRHGRLPWRPVLRRQGQLRRRLVLWRRGLLQLPGSPAGPVRDFSPHGVHRRHGRLRPRPVLRRRGRLQRAGDWSFPRCWPGLTWRLLVNSPGGQADPSE